MFRFAFAALPLLSVATAQAADFEYQLLVVACTPHDCQRVAEPKIAARVGTRSAYTYNNVKLEIETTAARLADASARLMVQIGGAAAAAETTFLAHSARLTSQSLRSLATFSSGDTVYHVWGKILP